MDAEQLSLLKEVRLVIERDGFGQTLCAGYGQRRKILWEDLDIP